MILVEDLTFAFAGGGRLFDRFSWQVEHGQAWSVIGASGCGKTTLLNLLAGLYRPTTGRILINGQPLNRPRPRTGLILQEYGLLPWATIKANAALGLEIRAFYGPDGIHAPVDDVVDDKEERVGAWLRRLGIRHVGHRYPHQVSGGQRQRTAIARALVLRPDLLLMDEPFGALDAPTRQDLQNLTMQLRQEQGLTTIVVTHSIEEAIFMGQHILALGQPPHREPGIIHNPDAGDTAYRGQDAFLARCRELRGLIGEEIREMA